MVLREREHVTPAVRQHSATAAQAHTRRADDDPSVHISPESHLNTSPPDRLDDRCTRTAAAGKHDSIDSYSIILF